MARSVQMIRMRPIPGSAVEFERRLDALEARFAAGERPGLKVVR
jgi:hypothetical protein